jgi:hypothetical protein
MNRLRRNVSCDIAHTRKFAIALILPLFPDGVLAGMAKAWGPRTGVRAVTVHRKVGNDSVRSLRHNKGNKG